MEYPWTKYINMDNLPNEDMKIVANVIGLEATIKIMCELQGVNISVPQNATLSAKIAYIQAENLAHANGLNSIDEILIKEVLNNDSEDKETM